MTARILDGKAVAAGITAALEPRVRSLSRPPGLTVVLVGDDPASAVYVRNKTRTAERLGMAHDQITLPASTIEAELLDILRRLNADDTVDGILVQFPIPGHIPMVAVLDTIHPDKDVDGLTPLNAGLLLQRRAFLAAYTPMGCMELLRHTGEPLNGCDAVVVGRSNLVGKPVAQLLEQADCTVTMAHSRTRDLAAHIARADIVVAAVGVAGLVKGEWIKPGARVIDVGMNRGPDGKLCGDVEYVAAAERAGWITPVPGGVGPMTIAMLMTNTVKSAERRQGLG